MKIYGLKVAEGSTLNNLCIPHSNAFPSNPSDGELFLLMKNDNSLPVLYVYVTDEWKAVSVSKLGKGDNNSSSAIDTSITNPQVGQCLIFDGQNWKNSFIPGYLRTEITTSTTLSQVQSYIGVRQTQPIIITLPNSDNGKTFTIKDELGNAKKWPITIQAFANNTIDMKSSIVLSSNFSSITIIMGKNNWSII